MTVFVVSFAIYTLLIVAVGVVTGRHAGRDQEAYFLGGRTLGPWVAALSAGASSESGWLTLGLVGWAFTSGVSAYWILPGVLLGYLFNWTVLAGRLRSESERLGAITIPDFLSMRFGEASDGRPGAAPVVRLLSVLVVLVAMWMYVAAQFAAAGKAFEVAFELPYIAGVGIGAAIVLLYTVIGGFRAACWTDFIQAIVMVAALVVFPLWMLVDAGGPAFIRDSLANVDDGGLLGFWPEQTGLALVGFLFGSGALGINFGYPGQPHVLVRFLALRSRRDAVAGAVISITWGALVLVGAVTLGLLARSYTVTEAAWTAGMSMDLAANAADAGETALVVSANALLPGILSGVVLAAVLAAICSTADSQLVVAASAAANDVYARLVRRGTPSAWVNRITVLLLGLGAIGLVLDPDLNVFSFVLEYGWAVLGAGFGPQVLLALWWKGATRAGAIAGIATGFGVALGWKWFYDPAATGVEIYNLPVAFIAALVVNVLVSLAAGHGDREPSGGK
ncbi:MAG: sodium/proline symporter [Planctomycetota bacterium]|nr:sodium/proline symporter [Planctomycetota bacterium]MEE2895688.1 sodium/proline symporter [Planctomycetota bacterium]